MHSPFTHNAQVKQQQDVGIGGNTILYKVSSFIQCLTLSIIIVFRESSAGKEEGYACGNRSLSQPTSANPFQKYLHSNGSF